MPSSARVPVAQYLRMSTNQQRFSLENQAAAIAKYADAHDLEVVQTYLDTARTGVVFRARVGLQQLIRDVVKGNIEYKAILVYDVSRWGRFQDTDEAAYYEFLCKSAGIPVHYCAEGFTNDNGLPSVIFKSLKRVMAAEYSRELGNKVFSGQRRLAKLGFRQGATPGYGLRRLLVAGDGTPKQLLRDGERKSIATDRVIQVPGPPDEVECINEIYRMFVRQRMTCMAIARELNRRHVPYLGDAAWNNRAVHTILSHPKYSGTCVYGRYSQRLYTRVVPVPQSEWVVTERAFQPLVAPDLFLQAQQLLEGAFHRNKSDQEMIDDLRPLLAQHGRINISLITRCPDVFSAAVYRVRFGSLSRVYQLLGLSKTRDELWLKKIRNIQRLRTTLMDRIVSLSGGRVSVDMSRPRHTRLRLRNGRLVTVLASRYEPGYKGAIRWLLKTVEGEQHSITLVARLNAQNDEWKDMFVIPALNSTKRIVIRENDMILERGVRLFSCADFFDAVRKVADGSKCPR